MEDRPQPLIVGFLCTWCAYRAADLVGTMRRPYTASLLPVRVLCTGRVSPELILEALLEGADGVLVMGCHPGECHRTNGNLKALARVALVKRFLEGVGIDPGRVEIVWASAAEGASLADAADTMAERLVALGPIANREVLAPRPGGVSGERGVSP